MRQQLPKMMAQPVYLRQIIVTRRDLPLPMGFLANQIAHAAVATIYPFLMEPTPSNMQNLHIQEPSVFEKYKENVKKWVSGIFYKTLLQTSHLNEFLTFKKTLTEKQIPFVLIKENGPIRIDKLFNVEKTGGIEKYYPQENHYHTPYDSQNSFCENNYIYYKPQDGVGTETVIGIPPIEKFLEPKNIKYFKLLKD